MCGLRSITGDNLNTPSLSLSASFSNSALPPLPTAPEMMMIPRKQKIRKEKLPLSGELNVCALISFCIPARLLHLSAEAVYSSHQAKEEETNP
jgi:hypothetical protein